jgi:oxygen-independent coproporphyrinogen-3 oxidase
VEEGLAVLELARQAGFWSVSADFMSGLAGQTLGEWRADLQRIAGLGFDHLSVYGLTVEPGTPLAERVACGEVVLPGDEDQADQLLETRWRLRAAGYEHYEISNYARRGHRAVHNSLYWTGGEYLGLGAGAHGFIRTGDGGVRWADVDDPREYMRRSLAGELPEESRERRTRDDLAREALMTRLRWLDGLDLDVFAMETGWDLGRTQAAAMEQLEDGGLIRVERGHLRLTERGILLLNPVTLSLLPGAEGIVLTTVSVPR